MINYFCKFEREITDPDPPLYLFNFVKYLEENFDLYDEQVKANLNPDFRIKEALINALDKISYTVI